MKQNGRPVLKYQSVGKRGDYMAGRKCSVCTHPAVNEINEMLVSGKPFNEIVTVYTDLTKMALSRHKQNHIPEILTRAREAQEVAQADDLLSQVQFLQNKALSILKQAEAAGELRTALQAIREARGNLELLAKLLGELQQEGTVNILISPEWLSLRTVILKTLEPYPEARLTLANALQEVEVNAFR